MTRLTHRPGVQALLGGLMGGYLALNLRTIRWRHHGLEQVEPFLAGEGGLIGLMWHGRIPLSLSVAPQWWRRRTKIMVSPSADGEITAIALARNGFGSIRGSSAKKGDAAKARAVVAAFRESLDWVSGGGALIISPDGPRGPHEVVAPGAVQIARRTGAPVFLSGIACNPAIRLDSWDRVMMGLPFGRGAVVWEGPLHVPADADQAQIDATIADWTERLRAATRRAEALCGRTPD